MKSFLIESLMWGVAIIFCYSCHAQDIPVMQSADEERPALEDLIRESRSLTDETREKWQASAESMDDAGRNALRDTLIAERNTIAIANALHGPKPVGQVKILNETGQEVHVFSVSWKDEYGRLSQPSSGVQAAWPVGLRGYTVIMQEDGPVRASEFRFRIEAGGIRSSDENIHFTARCREAGELLVTITPDMLPAHEESTTVSAKENLDRGNFFHAMRDLQRDLREKPEYTGYAHVIVKTLSVYDTKANGKAWDYGNGKPDPYVTVDVGRLFHNYYKTPRRDNLTMAVFDYRTARVAKGEAITVRVWDHDVSHHDLIGIKTLTVTEQMLRDGELRLTFGRVHALTIQFQP